MVLLQEKILFLFKSLRGKYIVKRTVDPTWSMSFVSLWNSWREYEVEHLHNTRSRYNQIVNYGKWEFKGSGI